MLNSSILYVGGLHSAIGTSKRFTEMTPTPLDKNTRSIRLALYTKCSSLRSAPVTNHKSPITNPILDQA